MHEAEVRRRAGVESGGKGGRLKKRKKEGRTVLRDRGNFEFSKRNVFVNFLGWDFFDNTVDRMEQPSGDE